MFLTQVLNGLQLGSIYALVALGYTMVYGIILLLNFAHGDIIMFGSYVAWIALVQLGLNPAIAVLLAIFGCVLLGVLIDKVAYAPLREAPRLSILITAIGVSYLLENGVQLLLGADAKVVPSIIDLGTVQVVPLWQALQLFCTPWHTSRFLLPWASCWAPRHLSQQFLAALAPFLALLLAALLLASPRSLLLPLVCLSGRMQ